MDSTDTPTPPPPGRKIHAAVENPFDNLMIKLADAAMPLFHATGHTPNAITAYSGLFAALAVWQAWRGNLVAFSVAWIVAYWFDCADGHYARMYGMETKLGDMLDHVKDTVAMLALIAVVWVKYNPSWLAVVAGVVVLGLSLVHLGCQQKHYAQHIGKNSGESLDGLQVLCPSDNTEEALQWTRYVGVGTSQLMTVALVWLVAHRRI